MKNSFACFRLSSLLPNARFVALFVTADDVSLSLSKPVRVKYKVHD
jgi:hypothetical protein